MSRDRLMSYAPTWDTPSHVDHDTITVGICCMAKKATSSAMREMIARLEANGPFRVIIFPEDDILTQPIETWPIVDCCIPFFSSGFPLEKAIEYAKRHPDTFYLTDPASQMVLLDRRAVYRALRRNNIPTAQHLLCDRDPSLPPPVVEESEDEIIVNGRKMEKPFVEKPVDSEDHNIIIYYHSKDGGGSRHLFRKVGDKSSSFCPEWNRIRRDGSYIYEAFVNTAHNQDVKVYTVGTRYQHAECRKAPCVDGVVERDAKGKEIRQRVELTEDEQIIAMKIVKVFRQKVCGFDLLRGEDGKSFVCDVNGWSFVKGQKDYYNKASNVIAQIFLAEMQKRGLHRVVVANRGERNLAGVVCVFRHADRTPKQKLKLKTKHMPLVEVGFGSHCRNQKSEAVFKGTDPALTEMRVRAEKVIAADPPVLSEKDIARLCVMVDVLRQNREGLKIQLKPLAWDAETKHCNEVQIVCKWGGWITEAGIQQAQNLGKDFTNRIFRTDPGSYTRNMKVYANSERRVIKSAEVVTTGLSSAPLIGGVKIAENILGDSSAAKVLTEDMKQKIHVIMHTRTPREVAPYKDIAGVGGVCNIVGLTDHTPYGALKHTHRLINTLVGQIRDDVQLYHCESVAMMRERWAQLLKTFYNDEKGEFDCTKIPDIFDYINYDVCYNQEALAPLDLYPLFEAAEALASFVTAAEYGVTPEEKLQIGAHVASPLLSAISSNISDMITDAEASKTHLYFTSESHLHTLRNCLYHNRIIGEQFHALQEPIELHYLTHLVFKVYEYPRLGDNIGRFQLEVHFSSGIDKNMFGIVEDHHTGIGAVTPMIRIHNNLSVTDFRAMVKSVDSVRKNVIT
eukprot:PhM_4_TR2465/c0_g1_i1/m.88799/K13024/PPIP5K, VIP; inositol-hexakisphosphate/diphosphoinositol-pentakisphosphate 1-kinase